MFRHYYINKEWIISAAARRIYRIAAGFSLLLLFIKIALQLPGTIPAALFPVTRWLLLLSILATAMTMVAMEYFLFGFDDSSEWKKVFWFCVMLFPPLGPALYCFLVYSRSHWHQADRTQPITQALM
jgi:hypothetical protein